MIGTPHILAGGAIGKRAGSAYLAVPLAFASHFALDALPHVDTVSYLGLGGLKSDLTIAADTIVGAAVLLVLARGHKRMRWILWSGFAAAIMDVIAMFPKWFPNTSAWPGLSHLCSFHSALSGSLPVSEWPVGVLTQVLTVALAVFFLIHPRERTRQAE